MTNDKSTHRHSQAGAWERATPKSTHPLEPRITTAVGSSNPVTPAGGVPKILCAS